MLFFSIIADVKSVDFLRLSVATREVRDSVSIPTILTISTRWLV